MRPRKGLATKNWMQRDIMKPAFLFLLCAAAMAGCSTLSREQLASYNQPGVPAPVAAKIQSSGKLSLSDVVDLSHSGMRSGEIMLYLAYSGSEFNLSDSDMQNLVDEGVSGDVITYMREKPNETGGLLSTFSLQ
jgi:hypothetical protein